MSKEINLTDSDWMLAPWDIGQRIKTERKARKWSQEKLAAKAGISRRLLSDVENAKSNIGIYSLYELLGELHLAFYMSNPPQYTLDDLEREKDEAFQNAKVE